MSNPLNATTTKDGRTYEWPPTGEVFDSVTTLIKYGTPTGYGLQKWLKRVNVEWAVQNRELWLPVAEKGHVGAAVDMIVGEADRVRDIASDRGTEVHNWAERIVLGTASHTDAPEDIRPYVGQFMKFLADWRPTYEATEATVYSRAHRYAGTLDWIARIPGHGLVLGDIKTKADGKTIYGEIGLQLAAYRYADFIGLPDGSEAPVPEVDACLALVIHPSSYDLIPVRAEPDVFRSFLYVAEVRRYCDVTAKGVLGRKLRPPAPAEVA